ncbi:MAG: zinc metalloprotease [Phycisphaerales bacterium]
MLTTSIAALLTFTGAAALGPSAQPETRTQDQEISDERFQVISDTQIIADGVTYDSWDALAQSGYHQFERTRCKTITFGFDDDIDLARGTPSDCTFSRTRIEPEYDPSVEKYRIPVVVHIIERTNGTGSVSDARVHSQIEVLNEDFQAIAGTNGAPGTDVQIEFYLATEDPNGNPTSGITRSTNNTWYNDGGAYYNTLAWDTNRYLNIYTNNGGGALGYVPSLPQSGIAGSNSDRVVILHSTFGRNAPYSPFNLGRTVTHEVGHYLGLDHTFAGGCSNSYTSGDLIVDTNPESSPTFGCPGSRTSCGSSAPIDNYMDYSDDRCMNKFTPEQANRMRCSLINYRPSLYSVAGPSGCSDADLAEPYGALNFFDVSAYLAAFNAQDAAADFDNNGSFDFFDVSLFLGLYNVGCP